MAVHDLRVRGSLPPSLFTPGATNGVDHISNRLSSLALDAPAVNSTPAVSKIGGVHAFDIAARILKDDKFNRKAPADFVDQFAEIFVEYSTIIGEHAEKWTVDPNQPGEIERKMEELIWLSSLIYGIGGSTPKGFQSDFFLCVTFLLTR